MKLSKDQKIQLIDLEIDPIHDKYTYGNEIGYQTDWIHLASKRIVLEGFDYTEYIDNGKLQIREVKVDSADLSLFRDKNIPFPVDQVRYMPQKMISEIEVPLTIQSTIINDVNIRYEEMSEGTSTSGFIDLTDLTAGISNITNDSSRLSENSTLMIAASTNFYGTGHLQADFEFDLLDHNGQHKYSAFLSEMDVTDFNQMLEPTENVHLKSGEVNEMSMHVEGNRDYVIGNMEFLYENLHFNLIGKKTGTTSAMGPALGSFFANTFIVNRNNPRLLFIRKGNIYYERDTTKSVINYITKAALSGVVSSIGARNNRKEIRQANKEAKEKQDRKKKKERYKKSQEAVISKEDGK